MIDDSLNITPRRAGIIVTGMDGEQPCAGGPNIQNVPVRGAEEYHRMVFAHEISYNVT